MNNDSMRMRLTVCLAVVLGGLVSVAVGEEGQHFPVDQDIRDYRGANERIRADLLPKESAPVAVTNLLDCGERMVAAFEKAARQLPAERTVPTNEMASRRDMLPSVTVDPGANGLPSVLEEYAAFERFSKFQEANYIDTLAIRDYLFTRRYLDNEKNGNFLELWFNGVFPVTRTEWDGQAKWRGVSPWEITTRVEPVVLLNGDHDPAVLLALGGVYNLFPDAFTVRKSETGDGNTIYTARPKDGGFLVSTVKRVGLRIGAGSTVGDDADFVAGAAVQVWRVDAWYLYHAGEHDGVWAVGVSDWDWIKKFLPFFGKN